MFNYFWKGWLSHYFTLSPLFPIWITIAYFSNPTIKRCFKRHLDQFDRSNYLFIDSVQSQDWPYFTQSLSVDNYFHLHLYLHLYLLHNFHFLSFLSNFLTLNLHFQSILTLSIHFDPTTLVTIFASSAHLYSKYLS